VATALGVYERTVRKWVARYRSEGRAGLEDRSSRPRRSPTRTPSAVERRVAELRHRRMPGVQIARETGISKATVHRILRRLGLNRLKALDPAEPVRRYERARPGELIHIDIKKLGRFNRVGHRITGERAGQSNQRNNGTAPGWEYVHVCIDDHSRVAFSRIYPNEKKESAVAFLKACIAYYKSLGITVERLMTDNGACYKSKAFARACKKLGIKHIFTKPYTPRINGKAERFI
jgi:transposase InsO family protein